MEYIRFVGQTMAQLWEMFMNIPSPLEGISFGIIRLGLVLLVLLMSGLTLSIAIPKRLEGDEIKRGGNDSN